MAAEAGSVGPSALWGRLHLITSATYLSILAVRASQAASALSEEAVEAALVKSHSEVGTSTDLINNDLSQLI